MNPPHPDADLVVAGVHPLTLATVCGAAFISALSFFAATPFYPEMAEDLDTTVPVLGQTSTLLMVVSALLGLGVGPVGDAYGYRRMLTVGVLAIAAYQLGFALAPSFPLLLAVTLLGAFGDAIVFGLALTLASVLFHGAGRRRAIGWAIASFNISAILGVPVFTFVGDRQGWRFAIGSFGLATLAFVWMIVAVLPADQRRPAARLRLREVAASFAPLFADPPSLRLLGGTVMRAMWILGLVTYFGAFLADELGLSTRNVGLMYMLAGTGATVGSVAAGTRVVGSSPRTTVALTSLAGGALLGVIIGSSSAVVTATLIPVMSALAAIASVGITTLLAAESPAQPGTTMALNASLLNIGGGLGAAVGGVLIALGGFPAFAIGLPVFAVAGGILVWWPSKVRTVAPGPA